MTHISLDELGQVHVPDLKGDGVGEQVDTTLVDLHNARSAWRNPTVFGRYRSP